MYLTRVFKEVQQASPGPVLAILLALMPAAAQADELAQLSDKSARIERAGSQRCQTVVTMELHADSAAFFQNRLPDLGNLFAAALRNLGAKCPNLKEVRLRGLVGDMELITAKSTAGDGWRLLLDQPRLDKVAASIPQKVQRFEDLTQLEGMFAPFAKVPGIAQTNGYFLFATNSKAAVDRLIAGFAVFDAYADKMAKRPDAEKALKEVEGVLSVVAAYNPQIAGVLLQRYLAKLSNLAVAELDTTLAETLTDQVTIPQAVKKIAAQVEGKAIDPSLVQQADQRLSDWVEVRLGDHEAAHPGDYLDDLQAHAAFVDALSPVTVPAGLPLTGETLDTAAFWFETLVEETLQANLDDAMALITEAGQSYLDVDLVMDTGIELSGEFATFGFKDEAAALSDHAAAHIEGLIAAGLQGYQADLAALRMTRDVVIELRDQAAAFADLSQDFPGFAQYAEVTEAAIRHGRQNECARQAGAVQVTLSREVQIDIGLRRFGLPTLACALYDNDHILTALSLDRSGQSGQMEIDTAEDGPVTFDLTATGGAGTLTGAAEDWEDAMTALIIPPPSGKPDLNGITECDQLAGDPQDPEQPTAGVDFETVAEDFDFDRAIEACIAAVEYDTGATRQMYQLARVLDYLGDADAAAPYLDEAVSRTYAPALHLKAFGILTYRDDDDAFFDAIDLFKLAAARDFAPSKRELNELMPPGSELFREIPPPTDDQVLDTVGRKKCESNLFASACSIRTGVAKKECFQTSATEFSCEVVFRHRCQMKTGMDGDPLMRMFTGMIQSACSPTTDPFFLKFTKNGDRWSYRKEF